MIEFGQQVGRFGDGFEVRVVGEHAGDVAMQLAVAVVFEELLEATLAAARGEDVTGPVERLRVSMGDAFVDWATQPSEGAEIAFIPPVSGG